MPRFTLDPAITTFPAYQARRLGARVAEFLRRPECEAAARRLRREFELLTDREAALHVADQRVYAAETLLSSLYTDESAAKAPIGRKPNADAIARIEQAIVEAKDELSRLRARRPAIDPYPLEARHNACSKLIIQTLSGGGRLKFISPPSPPRGATLEAVREKIAQLGADLKAVDDAPFPASFVRERAAKFISELASPINVRPTIESGADPLLPLIQMTSELAVPHTLGIVVWAMKDRIIELINREIDECCDDKAALTHDQRVKRTAEIKKEILVTERIEAAIEWQMMEAGEVPAFRHDANPRAILGVED